MLFCTSCIPLLKPLGCLDLSHSSLFIFSFDFSKCSCKLREFLAFLAVFWTLLPSRLLIPVELYHKKSPARPRLPPTRYGLSDPWILLKLTRFWCFYLLQIHCLNSILKVGVFWSFCDITILLEFSRNLDY